MMNEINRQISKNIIEQEFSFLFMNPHFDKLNSPLMFH